MDIRLILWPKASVYNAATTATTTATPGTTRVGRHCTISVGSLLWLPPTLAGSCCLLPAIISTLLLPSAPTGRFPFHRILSSAWAAIYCTSAMESDIYRRSGWARDVVARFIRCPDLLFISPFEFGYYIFVNQVYLFSVLGPNLTATMDNVAYPGLGRWKRFGFR